MVGLRWGPTFPPPLHLLCLFTGSLHLLGSSIKVNFESEFGDIVLEGDWLSIIKEFENSDAIFTYYGCLCRK